MNFQALTVSPELSMMHGTWKKGRKEGREGVVQLHGTVVESLDPGVTENWITILSLHRHQPYSLKQIPELP